MSRFLPRRSLAVSAVGALAVTGLALSPQPADAAGPAVLLLSQNDGLASGKYDGNDYAVQLTAQRLDPTAAVTFEFNRNPRAGNGAAGWTAIADPSTTTGLYEDLVWEPPNELLERSVALRAVAVTADGTTYSLRRGVVIGGDDDLEHSVSLGPSFFPFTPPSADDEFTQTGYFAQPYASTGRTATTMAVPGTTSAQSGSVALRWWRESDQTFRGRVDAAVQATTLKSPNGAGGFISNPGGTFAGVLNIAPFAPDPGDVIAVSAERSSDDVLPTTLIPQTIGSVEAIADSSQVRAGETARVPVYVYDTSPDPQPVAGAEVRRLSDGGLVGYTDGRGEVVARQPADTNETYYANTTDADPYLAGTDLASSEIAVSTYVPEVTGLLPYSQDGGAFDRDEYAAGDLYAQVSDQTGRPYGEGTVVRYKLYREGATPPATYRSGVANARGRVVVPLNRSLPAGDYRLDARLASWPESTSDNTAYFSMGDARLRLTPTANPVVTGVGGQVDYTGRLTMLGEPLTGRRISLRFVRGVEVVPGGPADAAITQGRRRVLVRAVTTGPTGAFDVTVDDPAGAPPASEIGGRLIAATADQPASATFVDGNAGARDVSGTRFGNGRRGSVRVVLGGAGNGPQDDELRVTAPTSVAGETVRIYRTAPGGRTLLATRRLGRAGDLPRVVVADRNGRGLSTYVVQLVPSRRVVGATSAPRRVG